MYILCIANIMCNGQRQEASSHFPRNHSPLYFYYISILLGLIDTALVSQYFF